MDIDESVVAEKEVCLKGTVHAICSFADVPVEYLSPFEAVIQKSDDGFLVRSLQMQAF